VIDTCSNYKERQSGILKNNMNKKMFFVENTSYINSDKRVTQFRLVPTEDTYWVILSESSFNDFGSYSDNFLQMSNSFSPTSSVTASVAEQTQQTQQQTQQTQQQTQQTQQQSKGGGCLIATAAFGSEMAPQVQFLRELRDNTVLQTESGTSFMTSFNQFYYSFSPAVADYERENPAFKEAVKITLTPLLTSLTLLQYADIDSESEMLGYGIGVILLNIGMYFVAPAVLIMKIRKRI